MLVYKYLNRIGQEKEIVIQLADTPFVNDWKKYLLDVHSKVPNLRWGFGLVGNGTSEGIRKDPWPIIDKLFDSFKFLQKHTDFIMEYDDYHLLKECRTFNRFVNNIDQRHLNRWHRQFTTLATRHELKELPLSIEVPESEIYQNIHNINIFVHALEYMTYPLCERRKEYLNQFFFRMSPVEQESYGYSHVVNDLLYTTELSVPIEHKFDFLTEKYDYTVWLNEDILGKDLIKTWLDHDDLTMSDVTGNLFMTPSLMFDPNKIISKILSKPEFREEASSTGKTLDRYPVGNIVNIGKIDWFEDFMHDPHRLTHCESSIIKGIELDGVVLWSYNIEKSIKFNTTFEPKTLVPRIHKWANMNDVKFTIKSVGNGIIKILFEKDEDYTKFFLTWNFKWDTRCYVFEMVHI